MGREGRQKVGVPPVSSSRVTGEDVPARVGGPDVGIDTDRNGRHLRRHPEERKREVFLGFLQETPCKKKKKVGLS